MSKYIEILYNTTNTGSKTYTFECNVLNSPEYETINNLGSLFTHAYNGYYYYMAEYLNRAMIIGKDPDDIILGQLNIDGDIKSVVAPSFEITYTDSSYKVNKTQARRFLEQGVYQTFNGNAPIEIIDVKTIIPSTSQENYRGILRENIKVRISVRLNVINTNITQPNTDYLNACINFGVFINGNDGNASYRFNRFRLYEGTTPPIEPNMEQNNNMVEQSKTTADHYMVGYYDTIHNNILTKKITDTDSFTFNTTILQNIDTEGDSLTFTLPSSISSGQDLITLNNVFMDNAFINGMHKDIINRINQIETIPTGLTINNDFVESKDISENTLYLVVSFLFKNNGGGFSSQYPNPFDVVVFDTSGGFKTLSVLTNNATSFNYISKDWVRLNYTISVNGLNGWLNNYQDLRDIIIRSKSNTGTFDGKVWIKDIRAEVMSDAPLNTQDNTSYYEINKQRPIKITLKEDPIKNEYGDDIYSKTLYWINPYGVYDSYRFIGRNDGEITITRDQRQTGNAYYDINISNDDVISYKNKVRQQYELTSYYLTQDERVWLEELYLSPKVYLYDENQDNFIRVNVLNNNHITINKNNQKLYQVKITIELSADRRTQQVLQ